MTTSTLNRLPAKVQPKPTIIIDPRIYHHEDCAKVINGGPCTCNPHIDLRVTPKKQMVAK